MKHYLIQTKLNLNSYLYCPKEDPKHRIQWKLDYSVDELNNFKEISENGTSNNQDLLDRRIKL